MNRKVLIIGGPTGVGKTSFGLELSHLLKGELVSADSRQAYVGMDIVTGKDIPPHFYKHTSTIKWTDRFLPYYTDGDVRIWLTDIVYPNEPFNVSFWRTCANLVITDIHSRSKLPIILGVTGLYLKSLTHSLGHIHLPPNPQLRHELQNKQADYLLDYLARLNPLKASSLNQSDQKNPRRLTRAIEVSQALQFSSPIPSPSFPIWDFLQIALTAPLPFLYSRIDARVEERFNSGAQAELRHLQEVYTPDLPSFTGTGYRALQKSDPIGAWKLAEHKDARQQLTWFKKQPHTTWFDISLPNWQTAASKLIADWYNEN